MAKCEYCGDEVVYPFKCSFCGGYFCIKHRLPENHECLFLPKGQFWYQKQKAIEKRIEREKVIKERTFSRHIRNALAATFIIALLIGGAILLPVLAVTTQSPIIVLLGFLGFFFLLFLLISYFTGKEK